MEKPRAYLFISGGFGADAGLQGIRRELINNAEHPDQVMVSNSVMSTDPQNPDRYRDQAGFIKEQVSNGANVQVITHSLGIVEAGRAVDILRKEKFFDDPSHAEKLKVSAVAPAGVFIGLGERTRFFRNYIDLNGATNDGINSLTAFPPHDIETTKLEEGISEALHEWKQSHPDARVIPFASQGSYHNHLDSKTQQELSNHDVLLQDAIRQGRSEEVRKLIEARGRLLNKDVQNVFEGKYEDGNDLQTPPWSVDAALKTTRATASPIIEMIRRKPIKDLRYLQERGVEVELVNFGYDRAVPVRTTSRFIEGTPKASRQSELVIVEGLGHSGLVLDPRFFIQSVT